MHKSAQAADAALFRGPMPRYAQLAGVLRQRIARNRWPPGTKLPTLEALMDEFDVARVTVRHAKDSYPPSVDEARSSPRRRPAIAD